MSETFALNCFLCLQIKIFHATKSGFISLHVDDDQKDHILQHISSDIPSANVLNVEE